MFDDEPSYRDFAHLVRRAKQVSDTGLHFVASGSVLASYVAILAPKNLGEKTPTILGLRTSVLAQPANINITVSLASLADRIARQPISSTSISVPPTEVSVGWSGILPPRGGWESVGELDAGFLESVAKAGIEEVARALPENPGPHIVTAARNAIWGSPIAEDEPLPKGAAFAAFTLGFLKVTGPVPIFTSGRWTRLSTPLGHVLIKNN